MESKAVRPPLQALLIAPDLEMRADILQVKNASPSGKGTAITALALR